MARLARRRNSGGYAPTEAVVVCARIEAEVVMADR